MTNHLLDWIIFAPIIGMFLVLLAPSSLAKHLTIATTFVVLVLSMLLFGPFASGAYGDGGYGALQYVTDVSWIDVGNFHIRYHVGLDGLSFPLIILTTFVTFLAAMSCWNFEHWNVNRGAKGFFALFLLLETGVLGTFAAIDFFLFYIFWEVMLLPMYFLIGVWGGPRKEYAAIKFFIFTLAGSVLMLVALLAMYYASADVLGADHGTFNLITYATNGKLQAFFNSGSELFLNKWNFGKAMFLMLFIAFAVKVPVFPFHTWLPDAHVEAPTPISMILAGVLLKLGAYGFLRVCYPIFPAAAKELAFLLAVLAVINILYGALCAMAQADFKRLVAYSSISHMGYVLLGIAVMNQIGFQGAMFQVLAHGISSPMCFFLVGVIYDRAHHRDINRFGGLWLQMPTYGSLATLGFFASLGLPALCGFIGEFWVLIGTYYAADMFSWARPMAILSAFGVVLTAGYILWVIQRVYLGKRKPEYAEFEDTTAREIFILVPMAALAIFMGILPQYTFNIMNGTLNPLVNSIVKTATQVAMGG